MKLLIISLFFGTILSAHADTYYDEDSFEEESYLTDYAEITESQIQDEQYEQSLDEVQSAFLETETSFFQKSELNQVTNDY